MFPWHGLLFLLSFLLLVFIHWAFFLPLWHFPITSTSLLTFPFMLVTFWPILLTFFSSSWMNFHISVLFLKVTSYFDKQLLNFLQDFCPFLWLWVGHYKEFCYFGRAVLSCFVGFFLSFFCAMIWLPDGFCLGVSFRAFN